jgi:hypothetical protein
MKKMIKKFGKLITASFIVMGVGIIVFILSLPLYMYCNIDTDILGFEIILMGLVILLVGIIRRKKWSRIKFALLITLASILGLPILILIGGLIYYLVTGKELGN